MARYGLAMKIEDVGKAAGVRAMSISKFERGLHRVAPDTVERLRAWFVSQGVEFINGGKAVGVRVPRIESLAEQGEQLKEAKAAHRKLKRLIKDKSGG